MKVSSPKTLGQRGGEAFCENGYQQLGPSMPSCLAYSYLGRHVMAHVEPPGLWMFQLQFVDTAGAEGDLSYEEFAAEIQAQVDLS